MATICVEPQNTFVSQDSSDAHNLRDRATCLIPRNRLFCATRPDTAANACGQTPHHLRARGSIRFEPDHEAGGRIFDARFRDRAHQMRFPDALRTPHAAWLGAELIETHPEGWLAKLTGPQDTARFVEILTGGGLAVKIRYRKGERIDAACGQLRRRMAGDDGSRAKG